MSAQSGWLQKYRIPAILAAAVALVAIFGALLHHHAAEGISKVALADSPKDVTIVRAEAATYQPTQRFVGTLRPWVEARVGPQFLSAYVSSVLVRPGALVKRNQVLATLDCRDASAKSRAVGQQARALQEEQVALAAQAQRVTRLLDGGYVAENDVQQQTAQSDAQLAKAQAEEARLIDTQLSVSDCVLRAPFDGDVGARWLDPGAFVHPGEAIVSVVDRTIVRLVVDVPEDDFESVAPGTQVTLKLLAVQRDLAATISRRSPDADPSTRTIHVEVDLPDPQGTIPVNTSAEMHIATGHPTPATRIPLIAADLGQEKAKLFVIEEGQARLRTLELLGESGGDVYFAPEVLPPEAHVVLEGRGGLSDHDKVNAQEHVARAPDAKGTEVLR